MVILKYTDIDRKISFFETKTLDTEEGIWYYGYVEKILGGAYADCRYKPAGKGEL